MRATQHAVVRQSYELRYQVSEVIAKASGKSETYKLDSKKTCCFLTHISRCLSTHLHTYTYGQT